MTQVQWWQRRWFIVAVSVAAMIPLLWPSVPPLVDLPGHMGRYRVQIDGGAHPWLAEWFAFHWSLIGNLGIDLLIVPLAPLLGLEHAVKLIVMLTPALTVAGLLWIAREVHGRVPATALFALPLAYNYPFQFGFVNFALSMALALNLFALWLRLARLGKLRLRAILFVPISCLLWLCHTFGWGVLGVLAFSAEMIRQHDLRKDRRSGRWVESWLRAGIGVLPLAPPALMMVLWRSGEHVTGETFDWFNWQAKFGWLAMVLRDRWMLWDMASTTVLYLILFRGVRDQRIEYSRALGLAALFLLAVFVMLPRVVFGSAYADMRLVPFMIALAIIALRPRSGLSARGTATLAMLGLGFYLARLAGTTASYALYAQRWDRALAAFDYLPQGAKVVTFIGRHCADDWAYSRLEHVPALLLERKYAYANDQWSMAGAQLLTTQYAAAGSFSHDPSQIVTDIRCPHEWWRPATIAYNNLPRGAFDYVWLLNPTPYDPRLLDGMTPIWRDGNDLLLRIDDRRQPPFMTLRAFIDGQRAPMPLPAADQPRLNGVSSPR